MFTCSKESFKHCPFYCEENVWHLCQEAAVTSHESYAVFISNQSRSVPFACQNAAAGAPGIYWDYHVVILTKGPESFILDLDSTLPFPCPAREYIEETFSLIQSPHELPVFRVIPAQEFVDTFASDRCHMKTPEGGFIHPPPTWPLITTDETDFNLWDFVDMTGGLGDILSLEEFWNRFCR